MRQGTFQWMKSVNKSMILNKIRKDGPISRAQIARETNLTPPTVSSNVKELIEQKMVEESDVGQSLGGRKPTMLVINNEAFYIIGVDAGPESIECIVADLAGRKLKRSETKLQLPINNQQFMDAIKQGIADCLQGMSETQDKVIGIGVAMHGVVDVAAGVSLYAPNLGLSDIPIKEELEKTFGLEVKVENDARAMALGEYWFGNHGELESMLAVNIGRGVGAGLIIEGKLYHGSSDIAGEIGHMTIDLHGEICECGNQGCLQTFVTGPAITRKVAGKTSTDSLTAEDVYEQAIQGNDDFAAILTEAGKAMGVGLTNLIHIVNPEKIVLGGGVSKAEKFILPAIRETIRASALTPSASQTTVEVSKLGDDATLIGAITLLLVDIFE
ncbi:ROK family transcriptional regulator [Planococcus sp. APC 3900]|uniref:ROK family transcriptional regulator n=1 Tax=Planococcus sp. APC 3900 TaxID=3035191 RepID=UPI0025B307C4|nr:ROK family transcriptional regulator [Planococcus sp. APC 3900]MDN3438474.1 ROK family transcriptional regulator [Planococcus sp. APC 3900]